MRQIDVFEELNRFRERLLDLTSNNRLLNYRKSRNRSLQIIDELPDEIYSRLVTDGKQFRFLPVDTSSSTDQSDTQQQLCFDCELPEQPDTDSDLLTRHTDNRLQTDRDPEQLESLLKNLRRNAVSSIEETGVNLLHLALGMLQWSDHRDPQKTFLAPLILIPVEIDKAFNNKTSRYEYALRYTGEEVQDNLSLAKKLENDFSLALPEFDDFATPEDYFVEIADRIEGTPDWRVRREALLGFFSFRKLMMYLDLDPSNWKDSALGEDSLLRRVFEGGDIDGSDALFATDYAIDANATASSINLVLDADSSQHSALVDILDGRSFVIEGPPGTGKSQTITNAIAAAIDQGKKVLFVSEKLAALDVVHRKLQELGLADFCMQLHSDKANPKSVIEQLRQRIDKRFRAPNEIDELREKLLSRKRDLAEYLEAANQQAGPWKRPLRELFWRSVELRSRGVTPFSVPDHEGALDFDAFDRRCSSLQELAQHVSEIGRPHQHPWRWLTCPTLRPAQEEELLAQVRDWHTIALRLQAACKDLTQLAGATAVEWISLASAMDASRLNHLVPDDSALMTHALPHCIERSQRTAALSFLKRLKEYHSLRSETTELLRVPVNDTRDILQVMRTLCEDYPLVSRLSKVTLGELPGMRTHLRTLHSLSLKLTRLADSLSDCGYGQSRTIRALRTAIQKHALMHHPVVLDPKDVEPTLFLAHSEQLFIEAQERAHVLLRLRGELSAFFAVAEAPPVEEITELVTTIRSHSGSLLKFLDKGYRRAIRRLRGFQQVTRPRKARFWAAQLSLLKSFLSKTASFAGELRYTDCLGPCFQGIDTDWDKLEKLLQWTKTVVHNGMTYEEVSVLLRRRTEHSDATSPSVAKQLLSSFLAEIDAASLRPLLYSSDPGDDLDLYDLPSLIEDAEQVIVELLSCGECWKNSDSLTVDDLHRQSDMALSLLESRKQLDADAAASESLGDDFAGIDTDLDGLENTLTWLDSITDLGLPHPALLWLTRKDSQKRSVLLAEGISSLMDLISRWSECRNSIHSFDFVLEESIELGSQPNEDPSAAKLLGSSIANGHLLSSWSQYCRAKDYCCQLGLSEFATAVHRGFLDAASVVDSYKLTILDGTCEDAINSYPALKSFSRQRMERVRREFQELDKELIQLNRKEIASKACIVDNPKGNSTGRVGSYTEMGLIRHEIGKQKRYCRIRSLLKRAPISAQSLKPCFMMSPLSVAKFLPPDGIEFDLVLMDEASQIKPEDALGTVARAKQLVVVGDPKQLPPTSFFEKISGTDIDEDEAVLADDTESILEIGMKAFPHVRRLKWHYRSQHESLIKFSNSKFYDDDLVVFPSAGTNNGQLGVRYHWIPDAAFQNGLNVVEAKAVANAIARHAIECPHETLGVGTLNLKQRMAIEDELDRLCSQDPQARGAVERLSKGLNGLMIKNLENLQGDERDVIFVSCTYGPDPASGRVANRFGPLTQETGWRRLNVLLTRARRRIEVFTSMTSNDVVGGLNKSRGVNALKDYLLFLEKGGIIERGIQTDREPDSPFELSVARAIEGMGLKCIPQVGVAGYFIDIGILKPDRDDEFLLGVECDGASYHSAASARDRDRLREEVVRSRGWKLHRIWSTDWFHNQRTEEQRLREVLCSLL